MSLPSLIIEFCHDTIIGHESAFYKVFAITKKTPTVLISMDVIGFISSATINYLNTAYVSLIKQDDPYITEKFDQMCKINNHSAICLLNVICMLITNLHLNLDRSKLDLKTYETYMASVKKLLALTRESTLETLNLSMSHQCKGIDIRTCDPNKPMFAIDVDVKERT